MFAVFIKGRLDGRQQVRKMARRCRTVTELGRPFRCMCSRRHNANLATPGNCYRWLVLLMEAIVIRKLKSGEYRLYTRKKDPRTGRRRNLGTFRTREEAEVFAI
jgi:hypothetical protein